jgi:hypothetical protein
MSPLVPAPAVMEKVSKWLKLDTIPTRIEVNGERKIVAIHETAAAVKNVSVPSLPEGCKS